MSESKLLEQLEQLMREQELEKERTLKFRRNHITVLYIIILGSAAAFVLLSSHNSNLFGACI